ncbi:hypothetical protein Ahia01_000561400 [Argonauta hians]
MTEIGWPGQALVLIKAEILQPDVFFNNSSLMVSDADENPNWSLTLNTNDFRIDSIGNIYNQIEFDYEKQSSYTFNVTADDGKYKSKAIVNVAAIDVQDFIPVFTETSKEASVSEDAAQNTFVLAVKAIDLDSTPSIVYELEGDASAFTIDQNGRIFTRASLDYENKKIYEFSATTKDGKNSPSIESRVKITINVVVSNL